MPEPRARQDHGREPADLRGESPARWESARPGQARAAAARRCRRADRVRRSRPWRTAAAETQPPGAHRGSAPAASAAIVQLPMLERLALRSAVASRSGRRRVRAQQLVEVALDDHSRSAHGPARACSRPAARRARRARAPAGSSRRNRTPWCARLRWPRSDPGSWPAAWRARAARPTWSRRRIRPRTAAARCALTCDRISVVRVISSASVSLVFLIFCSAQAHRPVVGHRGGADEDRGAGQLALHGGVHLFAAFHIDPMHTGRRRQTTPAR